MKKLLPWIIGLIGFVILTGCSGKSIKNTLTEENGQWNLKYNSFQSDDIKFYSDGNVEFLTATTVIGTGTYEVNEKEKRIVITFPDSKMILNDINIKDNGNITLIYGGKKLEMRKIDE
ncbi:hypothetical protein SHT67_14270 (plasmid) [Enterococcus faecalis]|uniref:hypothetical protein n=1 Tax=Enterococcus faecalis TaxID=1351 RepID=UPI0029C77B92|nr:hypothetical protein [Enterococcus faecalis]WPH48340.1 hypothetical protein SHT67_14270 [Enterococcus faecalis]